MKSPTFQFNERSYFNSIGWITQIRIQEEEEKRVDTMFPRNFSPEFSQHHKMHFRSRHASKKNFLQLQSGYPLMKEEVDENIKSGQISER